MKTRGGEGAHNLMYSAGLKARTVYSVWLGGLWMMWFYATPYMIVCIGCAWLMVVVVAGLIVVASVLPIQVDGPINP